MQASRVIRTGLNKGWDFTKEYSRRERSARELQVYTKEGLKWWIKQFKLGGMESKNRRMMAVKIW